MLRVALFSLHFFSFIILIIIVFILFNIMPIIRHLFLHLLNCCTKNFITSILGQASQVTKLFKTFRLLLMGAMANDLFG